MGIQGAVEGQRSQRGRGGRGESSTRGDSSPISLRTQTQLMQAASWELTSMCMAALRSLSERASEQRETVARRARERERARETTRTTSAGPTQQRQSRWAIMLCRHASTEFGLAFRSLGSTGPCCLLTAPHCSSACSCSCKLVSRLWKHRVLPPLLASGVWMADLPTVSASQVQAVTHGAERELGCMSAWTTLPYVCSL